MSTYVMSDIHGNLTAMLDILEQVQFNIAEDSLYLLGDYTDWGSESIATIKYCMKLQKQGTKVICLLGNHDLMFLEQLDAEGLEDTNKVDEDWLANGGGITYLEFMDLPLCEREAIYKWLQNLPYVYDLQLNDKQYILCHSVPVKRVVDKESEEYYSNRHYATWSRRFRYGSPKENLDRINEGDRGFEIETNKYIKCDCYVHGHSINHIKADTDVDIEVSPEEIALDCGAKPIGHEDKQESWKYYRLGCIRLDDLQCFYSRKHKEDLA